MIKALGANLGFPPAYLNAAVIVSLLSVLVLIGLFYYLNRYTGRRYFNLWTIGWVFYALWLGVGLGAAPASAGPLQVMLKEWCVGASAVFLFWGSVDFLKLPARPHLFALFIAFLLAWSYIGAYFFKNSLLVRAGIFAMIGLASLLAASSFYRLRKHREYIGAGLLSFGFVLWGIYLVVCPFFQRNYEMISAGFLISAVLQLFIAVSMIVLVLEEVRAANELVLEQIRSCHLEAREVEAQMERDEAQYHGLFDKSSLNQKLWVAYTELRRSQEKSLQQERLQALGQMSRGIAHDINNALTPIMGYTNLLLRPDFQLPDGALNYIRNIRGAGEKISRSVSCIRDFYRKNDPQAALVPLELNRIAQEAVQATQPQWRDSIRSHDIKLELVIEFSPDLPRIMGKASELREALAHLIVNAIQAMPRGGVLTLRTRSQGLPIAPAGETPVLVIMEIIDTGVGMDAETRKRCPEPFFSTKSHQGAKGLGLSHVFGIMQRHAGALEIESEPEKGTLIRLAFPATQIQAPPEPAVLPRLETTPVSLKVLCIDDQQSILDVLKIILQSAGHKVETALNGRAGLDAFRAAAALQDPFAVVITDLGMPGMDGRQVAKIIKEESGTPVIMLTGWGDIMQAEGNQPENIDAIISKPPGANQLLETLRNVAANSKINRSNTKR
ncbi:MAG TPA: response regulator [Verrucomicrobiae bacterium]|nr:response regulator [Verrucomicrobiae bacterium]